MVRQHRPLIHPHKRPGNRSPGNRILHHPCTVLGTAVELVADPAPGILFEVDDRICALGPEPPARNTAKIQPATAMGREASRRSTKKVPGDRDCRRRQSTQDRNTNKHLKLACQR